MTRVWKWIWRRPPPWNDLCVTHDRAYWAGGTVGARRAADRALMAGVTLNGYPLFAILMWTAVRTGGHPLLPLSWRWGYGYRWPRGYDRHARQTPE